MVGGHAAGSRLVDFAWGSMPTVLNAQQMVAERTRTIDQIKPLYAVVIGYAVTTCFSNIYLCAQAIGFAQTYGISMLLAQGITYVSLITLFYLGAERFLDTRYLDPESRVPSRSGLLFDLLSAELPRLGQLSSPTRSPIRRTHSLARRTLARRKVSA